METNVINYITSAPYFWLSMGMVSAVAIFVGAIIYDGNLSAATKGLISVILYAFFIFQVDFTRINNLFSKFPDKIDTTRYAGIVTILIVTIFWIIGIVIGVIASYFARKIARKKNKK